jgi:hypothetical protein
VSNRPALYGVTSFNKLSRGRSRCVKFFTIPIFELTSGFRLASPSRFGYENIQKWPRKPGIGWDKPQGGTHMLRFVNFCACVP